MPDKRKVIKGLECCSGINKSKCTVCPYYHTHKCLSEGLLKDALMLLKDPGSDESPVEPVHYLCNPASFPECSKDSCFMSAKNTRRELWDVCCRTFDIEHAARDANGEPIVFNPPESE